MTTFTLDADNLRRHLADVDEDDRPCLWESPGRSMEEIANDYDGFISCDAEGWSISLYTMVWEYDPDTVMVVVRHSDFRRAGLAGLSQDWDDLLPGPRDEYILADPLTVDQVVAIVQAIVDEANRILADDEAARRAA